MMKTIGLLSLMVQSGCHIPAAYGSELRVFSEIFVDMGDEQSIENDLSSFSSHLQNLKIILENSRRTSLILIDEIGSGTDPTEGYSLAAAILEQLANVGSLNIATTHHGTLKSFAYAHPLIRNGAMEFDQATLRPTYRFRLGIPGSSYAIEMAERMKVPSNIIHRSRELKGEAANKLEQLIIDLERQSQELRQKLEQVDEEKQRLNNLNLVYQSKVSSLQKELKEMKIRAVDEAKHIVDRANALVEKSIRQIRESAASRPVIKQTKEELQELKREFSHLADELTGRPTDAELRIGDVVRLKHAKTEGEIAERIDDDHYLVLMGEMRVKVSRKELEVASRRKLRKHQGTGSTQVLTSDVKREIDIRGMYGDEAVAAVDKFIDEAVVAGLHRIDIIHGKGTGALRRKISEYLKKHAAIKSFRLGEWNEGGTGVTVVEL